MGFPVVLKIVSPEILHKTEAGGVLVGMKSAEDVQQGDSDWRRQGRAAADSRRQPINRS
jgi:acyl-CoA synthetase (NDP forming)